MVLNGTGASGFTHHGDTSCSEDRDRTVLVGVALDCLDVLLRPIQGKELVIKANIREPATTCNIWAGKKPECSELRLTRVLYDRVLCNLLRYR
jgi:hypothetical protein